ncbi:CHASE2 domain-containing protein, partial [Sandarakinorhabdus sp.]|uniref:CHASE2 domain-containing protein n=1 Tax=Sandarakinorhabdus sp. TaxID=1916663 RepID=UPI00356A8F61
MTVRRLAPFLTAGVVGLLAPAAVLLIAPLKHLETRLQDIRVAAMQAPLPPSRDLAVIAIDEATLARFAYRSPIDRGFLADVITALEAKGVRAIGVDVLIDQPTEPAKDARLKAVIASAKVPLRFSFTASTQIMTPEQRAYQQSFVPPVNRMEARLLTDAFDGTVRRINPGGELVNGQRRFSAATPRGFVPTMVAVSGGTPSLSAKEIAWRPRPDAENQAIPTFSALYLPFLPDQLLRGRTVLVGAVLSITDRHLTPLSIV